MANINEVQSIKVYCRLKPLDKDDQPIKHITKKNDSGLDILSIRFLDKTQSSNNKQNNFTFLYHKIFDEFASQSMVFDQTTTPIVNKFIQGFNGTVFTYGQTGSGKTHTICGTTTDDGKGIIPRSFELIFDTMNRKAREENVDFEVKFSYIEIYNEVGYDLLFSKKKSESMSFDKSSEDTDDLDSEVNRVTFGFDKRGRVLFQNLSCHQVNNLNDALVLIREGDLRRRISPTPMNIQSSRSHCICMVILVQKPSNSKRILKSKLNLVDLAGSERIWRSKVEKQTLSEARYINLSLHFLEQVIVTLSSTDNNIYVPYRNSMMTSLLKGSLGGNCFTAMIANLVLNRNCILESISTCRFAQRVASVENRVRENWFIDPTQEIILLRKQVALSKIQENENIVLSERETEECKHFVRNFMADEQFDINIPRERNKIVYCFKLIKDAVMIKNKIMCSSENKQTNTEKLLKRYDSMYSLNAFDHIINLEDKAITVLIKDHDKKKVKYAASVDKRFMKKIQKLAWDVYEDFDTSFDVSEITNGPIAECGGGDCNQLTRVVIEHDMSLVTPDKTNPRCQAMATMTKSTNTYVNPMWTYSRYMHLVPCTNPRSESHNLCFSDPCRENLNSDLNDAEGSMIIDECDQEDSIIALHADDHRLDNSTSIQEFSGESFENI